MSHFLPFTKSFNIVRGSITEPGVELGGIFELLAAESWDDDEVRLDLGQSGEVGPEFFELGDGKDIFLAVAPAFFDLFEGDVGGEAFRDVSNGRGDFLFVLNLHLVRENKR